MSKAQSRLDGTPKRYKQISDAWLQNLNGWLVACAHVYFCIGLWDESQHQQKYAVATVRQKRRLGAEERKFYHKNWNIRWPNKQSSRKYVMSRPYLDTIKQSALPLSAAHLFSNWISLSKQSYSCKFSIVVLQRIINKSPHSTKSKWQVKIAIMAFLVNTLQPNIITVLKKPHRISKVLIANQSINSDLNSLTSRIRQIFRLVKWNKSSCEINPFKSMQHVLRSTLVFYQELTKYPLSNNLNGAQHDTNIFDFKHPENFRNITTSSHKNHRPYDKSHRFLTRIH